MVSHSRGGIQWDHYNPCITGPEGGSVLISGVKKYVNKVLGEEEEWCPYFRVFLLSSSTVYWYVI